ncbi:hypothetical protein [Streptomyces sp. Wh19]|uniref:Oxidoreductase n=1 Tax=Streptomyces sanglieri TaxID=193460 RepID=A0ABW2WNP9_9ACTN|nr:hypothetical protein [Streptomyces sp. Wh19]MDV9199995.1 hypothetical protein [Streptomyces sp. Wh19]
MPLGHHILDVLTAIYRSAVSGETEHIDSRAAGTIPLVPPDRDPYAAIL